MSKDTISQIISAVLTLIITLLAIFGYNVIIVQPQLRALTAVITGCN